MSLPWQSGNKKLSVSEAGGRINIVYEGKVAVSLRLGGDLSVTVPENLLDHVKGLCASRRTVTQRIKWSILSVTKYMRKKLSKITFRGGFF